MDFSLLGDFITALIALCFMYPFRWLITSWFNSRWSYVSINLSISPRFWIYLNLNFQSSPWSFPRFPWYLLLPPFFISDFINFGLFPSDSPGVFQSYFFYQRTSFLFCWFFHFFIFFVFILLISALIFIISLLLVFGLACSHFSRCLRCSIRSFIWDLSEFLICALRTINVSLRTAFSVFHRFW
jgi:hypothetical protein